MGELVDTPNFLRPIPYDLEKQNLKVIKIMEESAIPKKKPDSQTTISTCFE
jgi:hypothetical protein